MRAVGHGLRVLVIQFLKKFDTGEVMVSTQLDGLTVKQFGTGNFCDLKHPEVLEFDKAKLALEEVRKALGDSQYDIIILDEINLALHHKLVPLAEVLAIIKNRRSGVDLILTGRHAPAEIIELADTVSEIIEVKHHQFEGYSARKGIEY